MTESTKTTQNYCIARRWIRGEVDNICEKTAKYTAGDDGGDYHPCGKPVHLCKFHFKQWVTESKPVQKINGKQIGLWCGTIYDTQFSISFEDSRFDFTALFERNPEFELELQKPDIRDSDYPPFMNEDGRSRIFWYHHHYQDIFQKTSPRTSPDPIHSAEVPFWRGVLESDEPISQTAASGVLALLLEDLNSAPPTPEPDLNLPPPTPEPVKKKRRMVVINRK